MTTTEPTATAEFPFHPDQDRHPCTYSSSTLDLMARLIDEECERLGRVNLRVLDRFAGTGVKVAEHATGRRHRWFGLEIEPSFIERDWVREGNARRSPFEPASFDVDACSVVFPNGMCLDGDTLVMTLTGYRPLREIEVGDMVLTHRNRWRRVMSAGCTGYRRDVVTVRGTGLGAVTMTTDHPIYGRWNGQARVGAFGEPEWVPAGRIADRDRNRRWYVATPAAPSEAVEAVSPPDGFSYSTDFWWGVGFWLANGWTTHTETATGGKARCAVGFAQGWYRTADHEQRIRRAFGRATLLRSSDAGGCNKWEVYSRPLLEWFHAHFGRLAAGKRLPGWALGLPDTWRLGMLDGYLAGDGCSHSNNVRAMNTASSVSKPLLLGVQLLATSLGRSATLHGGTNETDSPCWQLDITDDGRSKFTHHRDGLNWAAVRSVEPAAPRWVFDLTVEEDHSFVAEGLVVHNCDTFKSKEPSLRHTYSHAMRARVGNPRADLHPDNAGGMPWGRGGRKHADGAQWKAVHVDAIADAWRVLRPGGLLLWEASNHPHTPKRGGEPIEIDVIGWLAAELQRQGFVEEAVIPIDLQRTKDQAKGRTVTWRGTNAHRAMFAHLLCFRRPE